VNRYVSGTRGHVPDLVVREDTTYRLITDHLGSVRAVVDIATGEVVQRLDYDTWGNLKTDTNPGFQSLGYVGGLMDCATGLIRFGARDYDPSVGRWTAKDPIGFGGGDANLYTYVKNHPTHSVDVAGTSPRYPHHYNCRQTREIIQWAREETQAPWLEAMLRGFQHHSEGGTFDYKINEAQNTFMVGGGAFTADQFGNFLAGYTGQRLGPSGFWSVRTGGVYIDFWASRAAKEPFDWDMDSVPAIDAGARYARQERVADGRGDCGCP